MYQVGAVCQARSVQDRAFAALGNEPVEMADDEVAARQHGRDFVGPEMVLDAVGDLAFGERAQPAQQRALATR